MQFLFFVNEQKLSLRVRRLKSIFQSRHRIRERLKRDFEPVEEIEKSENEPKIITGEQNESWRMSNNLLVILLAEDF